MTTPNKTAYTAQAAGGGLGIQKGGHISLMARKKTPHTYEPHQYTDWEEDFFRRLAEDPASIPDSDYDRFCDFDSDADREAEDEMLLFSLDGQDKSQISASLKGTLDTGMSSLTRRILQGGKRPTKDEIEACKEAAATVDRIEEAAEEAEAEEISEASYRESQYAEAVQEVEIWEAEDRSDEEEKGAQEDGTEDYEFH